MDMRDSGIVYKLGVTEGKLGKYSHISEIMSYDHEL